MQIKFCHVGQKSAPHGDLRAVTSLWTIFFSPKETVQNVVYICSVWSFLLPLWWQMQVAVADRSAASTGAIRLSRKQQTVAVGLAHDS